MSLGFAFFINREGRRHILLSSVLPMLAIRSPSGRQASLRLLVYFFSMNQIISLFKNNQNSKSPRPRQPKSCHPFDTEGDLRSPIHFIKLSFIDTRTGSVQAGLSSLRKFVKRTEHRAQGLRPFNQLLYLNRINKQTRFFFGP
jgi:hypothetical protein